MPASAILPPTCPPACLGLPPACFAYGLCLPLQNVFLGRCCKKPGDCALRVKHVNQKLDELQAAGRAGEGPPRMLGADWFDLLGWSNRACQQPARSVCACTPCPHKQTDPFCSRLLLPGDANKVVELLRYFLQETTPEQAYHLVSAAGGRELGVERASASHLHTTPAWQGCHAVHMQLHSVAAAALAVPVLPAPDAAVCTWRCRTCSAGCPAGANHDARPPRQHWGGRRLRLLAQEGTGGFAARLPARLPACRPARGSATRPPAVPACTACLPACRRCTMQPGTWRQCSTTSLTSSRRWKW